MELGHRPRILCRGYLGPECVYMYVAMMAVKVDERRVVLMYILTLQFKSKTWDGQCMQTIVLLDTD